MKNGIWLKLLIICLAARGAATELQFAGYAGNSGNVRIGPSKSGAHWGGYWAAGPVYDDPSGRLYASAGTGRINAYRLDGEQVATHTLPKARPFNRFDTMARSGDELVVLAGGTLYRLALGAADGIPAEEIRLATALPKNFACLGLSVSSRDGHVIVYAENTAVGKEEGWLIKLNPKTGAWSKLTDVDARNLACMLDWGPDGQLYFCMQHRWLWKFENGKWTQGTDWPRNLFGSREISMSRGAFLNGDLWTLQGFTVKRLGGSSFAPQPGVVHGGASGCFIGRIEETNHELDGAGIALIRDGLYAIASAVNSAVYLFHFDAKEQHLYAVRRLGALPACNHLALTRDGYVLADNLVWRWDDAPNAVPPETYQNHPIFCGILTDGGVWVTVRKLTYNNHFHAQNNKILHGTEARDWELPSDEFEKDGPAVGEVILPDYKKQDRYRQVLRTDASGAAAIFRFVAENGELPQMKPIRAQLRFDAAAGKLVSLIGAGPGCLAATTEKGWIEFEPDGERDWKQARFQPDAEWANRQLATDGVFLATVDSGKGCLEVRDARTRAVLAKVAGLDHPTRVAVSDHRIIVYEAGQQRLVKYLIE